MNFEFSQEQILLREQARGFLNDNCPTKVVRAILEGDEPYDRELWQKIVDMGWTATVIPEEYDGLGLSYLELVVIAEELGRAVAPVPFSSSVYLATEAILAAGSKSQKEIWLPKLAQGQIIGCFALAEAAGQAGPDSINAKATNGKLSGSKIPVADGDIADFAIVAVSTDKGDGMSLYLTDLTQSSVSRRQVATLDPSRSHAQIDFDAADAELLGEDGAGWAHVKSLYNRAAVLYAWEQIGGADVSLDMAREYALGRFTFGRPIATYQVIKHKMTQMYVKNTLARSNCYHGAWALSTGSSEIPVAAATSRVGAIQAYYFASKENIQIHGGMGFTWEFDCQFHYRRSKLLAMNIGGETVWQDKLITAIEQSKAA